MDVFIRLHQLQPLFFHAQCRCAKRAAARQTNAEEADHNKGISQDTAIEEIANSSNIDIQDVKHLQINHHWS